MREERKEWRKNLLKEVEADLKFRNVNGTLPDGYATNFMAVLEGLEEAAFAPNRDKIREIEDKLHDLIKQGLKQTKKPERQRAANNSHEH